MPLSTTVSPSHADQLIYLNLRPSLDAFFSKNASK
ncbi:hypothetical protein C358_02039 [Cryptococcus neoformans MW-RSA852]|nr:hypothetical protein C358_02039 [Cryptococcus neoformans var. grubii MW-RSA852]